MIHCVATVNYKLPSEQAADRSVYCTVASSDYKQKMRNHYG